MVDYEGLSAYILRDALVPEPGTSVRLFSECGWAEWLDHWCEAGLEEGSGLAQPWEEELCALLPHRLDAHHGTVAVSSDREVILVLAEDPEAMTPAAVFDTGVIVNRIRLFGAYLYVAGPFGKRVLHVRDPLNPEIVSSQQEEPVRSWVNGRERIGGYMARTSNLGLLTFMAVEKE